MSPVQAFSNENHVSATEHSTLHHHGMRGGHGMWRPLGDSSEVSHSVPQCPPQDSWRVGSKESIHKKIVVGVLNPKISNFIGDFYL